MFHFSVTVQGQDFTNEFLLKCPHVSKDRDFLIIGHAGGDSYRECENTLEATEAALERALFSSTRNVRNAHQNHSNIHRGNANCLVEMIRKVP